MQRFEKFNIKDFQKAVGETVRVVSAETFGWIAVVLLHAATIPGFLAVMSGLTDQMPPIDLVLIVWLSLSLLFIKSAVQRDVLTMVTIGSGFIVQASMMALIFFK